jgi:hypothetical protein
MPKHPPRSMGRVSDRDWQTGADEASQNIK